MFWLHPGVLFNDRWIGHGISLLQNYEMEKGGEERGREREKKREWERSQHYTVINL